MNHIKNRANISSFPWKVIRDENIPLLWGGDARVSEIESIVDANNNVVVQTDCGYYPPKEADAYVIAAAPECAQSLYWTLKFIEENMDRLGDLKSEDLENLKAAHKAVNKAYNITSTTDCNTPKVPEDKKEKATTPKKFIEGQLVAVRGTATGEGNDKVVFRVGKVHLENLDGFSGAVSDSQDVALVDDAIVKIAKMPSTKVFEISNEEEICSIFIKAVDSVNELRGFPKVGKVFRYPELVSILRDQAAIKK